LRGLYGPLAPRYMRIGALVDIRVLIPAVKPYVSKREANSAYLFSISKVETKIALLYDVEIHE